MSRHTLPKTGTRARRVLDALFSFPVGPVVESSLMARHLLNHQSPANWRKVVYQRLQDDYLITPSSDGFTGAHRWMLTDKALRLLRSETVAAELERDAPVIVSVAIVPPRTVRPFRPLTPGTVGMRVMRDGALDYQSIPSLMGGRRCY
jgi:hypothetical protein